MRHFELAMQVDVGIGYQYFEGVQSIGKVFCVYRVLHQLWIDGFLQHLFAQQIYYN
jgi:hypothetical protein